MEQTWRNKKGHKQLKNKERKKESEMKGKKEIQTV
jgi:hypothetical protein